jgi:chaperonin cofactor prefoldin
MTRKESIKDLEVRYEALSVRYEAIDKNKVQVEAEMAARKRELKKLMQQARDLGFDPDNLKEEIQRKKQVLAVKLDGFEADMDTVEKMIQPMLQEIQGN